MSEQTQEFETPITIEPLGFRGMVMEIILALAIAVGMALLWPLENVRNAFFRLLDRFGVKGRAHRASAFPPGRARKLKNQKI